MKNPCVAALVDSMPSSGRRSQPQPQPQHIKQERPPPPPQRVKKENAGPGSDDRRIDDTNINTQNDSPAMILDLLQTWYENACSGMGREQVTDQELARMCQFYISTKEYCCGVWLATPLVRVMKRSEFCQAISNGRQNGTYVETLNQQSHSEQGSLELVVVSAFDENTCILAARALMFMNRVVDVDGQRSSQHRPRDDVMMLIEAKKCYRIVPTPAQQAAEEVRLAQEATAEQERVEQEAAAEQARVAAEAQRQAEELASRTCPACSTHFLIFFFQLNDTGYRTVLFIQERFNYL